MKTGFGQLSHMDAAAVMDVDDDKQQGANAEIGRAASNENLPEYDTNILFAGRREIIINHAGAAYRMKITKQGKLILNK